MIELKPIKRMMKEYRVLLERYEAYLDNFTIADYKRLIGDVKMFWLTAIDLKNYSVLSMVCYIVMGWGIIFFVPQTIRIMTLPGFVLLLSGGIAYTVGAILYGIGVKVRWMHSVFHIFVVIGSILQFLSILIYVL